MVNKRLEEAIFYYLHVKNVAIMDHFYSLHLLQLWIATAMDDNFFFFFFNLNKPINP